MVRVGSVAIKGCQYAQHIGVGCFGGSIQGQECWDIKCIVWVGSGIDQDCIGVGLLTERCQLSGSGGACSGGYCAHISSEAGGKEGEKKQGGKHLYGHVVDVVLD